MFALSIAVKTSSALRLVRNRSIMERVEDYPRPPRVEETQRRLQVFAKGSGERIVDTRLSLTETESPGVSYRVLETFHPPTYYIPSKYCSEERLKPSRARKTFCEWKGKATYLMSNWITETLFKVKCGSIVTLHLRLVPLRIRMRSIQVLLTALLTENEWSPSWLQPGDFYGGWKTKDITGKIKGSPGTMFW